jgi:putative toxin-antitoxin system antitoxin component (TIGR02293 family)
VSVQQIILNRIRTPDGTTLTSYHHHDYKEHKDLNGEIYFVDGGVDNLKRSKNVVPPVELSEYLSASHEKNRNAFHLPVIEESASGEYRLLKDFSKWEIMAYPLAGLEPWVVSLIHAEAELKRRGVFAVRTFLGIEGEFDLKKSREQELYDIATSGLSLTVLNTLCERLGMNVIDFCIFAGIDSTSLPSQKNDRLPIHICEQLIDITELSIKGATVFGELAIYADWLQTPIIAFEGKKPACFLNSRYGIMLVHDELGRIDHGIPV